MLFRNFVSTMVLMTAAIPSIAHAAKGLDGWRAQITHRSAHGTAIRTTLDRELTIHRAIQQMSSFILESPKDTPYMSFRAEEGAGMRLTQSPDYDRGIPTQYAVSQLGAEGKLKGTLLLPVSGHVGTENALNWATSDTYDLYVLDSRGNRTDLAQGVDARYLVTAHDFEVQLEKGATVQVIYNRSGSAGPAGYYAGRVLELVWDGT